MAKVLVWNPSACHPAGHPTDLNYTPETQPENLTDVVKPTFFPFIVPYVSAGDFLGCGMVALGGLNSHERRPWWNPSAVLGHQMPLEGAGGWLQGRGFGEGLTRLAQKPDKNGVGPYK